MDKDSNCRICLNQLKPSDGVNIFSTSIDDGRPFSTFFPLLFGFEVSPDDHFPEVICPKCILGIELSLSLRKQAVTSNDKLKSSFDLSIEEDTEDPVDVGCEFDEASSDETDAVSFLLDNIKSQKKSVPTNNTIKEAKKYRFKCLVCEKAFQKRTNLMDHLKIHAGVKSFRCSICDKAFIQYGNLKAHMRIHTKERPYVCEICEKSYTQSSALKIHMRSHTNDRSYVCDFCPKSFTNSSDLGKHKKTHDAEKDYVCIECNHQFTQKVHAKKHIKALHPDANIDRVLVKRSDLLYLKDSS